MATVIKKFEELPEDILDQMEKKHPPKGVNGIVYDQTMDYVTVEVNTITNSPVLRKLVKKDSRVLVTYMYLRAVMCLKSWYIEWTETSKEDFLERLTLWNIPEEDGANIIDALIDNKLIRTFYNKDNVLCLTDVQQLYNWEMLQAKRERDRKSKQNKKDSLSSNTEKQNIVNASDSPFGMHDDGLPFN